MCGSASPVTRRMHKPVNDEAVLAARAGVADLLARACLSELFGIHAAKSEALKRSYGSATWSTAQYK